jgi:hypothetical protein
LIEYNLITSNEIFLFDLLLLESKAKAPIKLIKNDNLLAGSSTLKRGFARWHDGLGDWLCRVSERVKCLMSGVATAGAASSRCGAPRLT